MMARMTPVSLHFSDVPTGWEKKSLQTNNSWLLVLHVRHEQSLQTNTATD